MRNKASILASNESGFTLVEILAVSMLIIIMMTVLVKSVSKSRENIKAQLNFTRMQSVKQNLSQYRLQYNTYPSKLEDMIKPSADVTKNTDSIFTPLLTEDELNDAWDKSYLYRLENSGRSYALTSLGADGTSGGEGANQDVTLHP